MKLRIFSSLLIGLLVASIPFLALWIGGGEFVRGRILEGRFVLALLIFIGSFTMAVACPLWSEK